MIAIIQCAGSKQDDASSLSLHGEALAFCARPESKIDVRPWDRVAELGGSWIDCIKALNNQGSPRTWAEFEAAGIALESPPKQVYRAFEIYTPRCIPNPYEALAEAVDGPQHLYILSAGWGLVRGDRLTPTYNVTFAADRRAHVDPAHRGREASLETDIPDDGNIHLFLSSKYLDYWNIGFGSKFNHRSIVHWRAQQGEPPGTSADYRDYVLHDCPGPTNWQYQAAKQFLADL